VIFIDNFFEGALASLANASVKHYQARQRAKGQKEWQKLDWTIVY